MFVFRKIWRALFSWNTHFEIRPFILLPTKYDDVDYCSIQRKFFLYNLSLGSERLPIDLEELNSKVYCSDSRENLKTTSRLNSDSKVTTRG